jgi:leader peptidase (prepilin peptidase) / N-methyltransferase
MEFIILFFLGLAVGSFLNVVIDRLSNDQSIAYPSSHCDFCKKPLPWHALIPVISFFFYRGRCLFCKKKLSIQYPVVELLTGVFFVITFLWTNSHTQYEVYSISYIVQLIYYLFIISSCIAVFVTDFKYGIILDSIILPASIVSLLYTIINHQSLIVNHLFSALGAFLFFLAIFLGTKGRGMGFGDVKLAILLGLFLGFPKIILALYLAFLTGAGISIILMILRRKKVKETIVFGPFLIFGTLVIFFFQDKLDFIWRIIGVLP